MGGVGDMLTVEQGGLRGYVVREVVYDLGGGRSHCVELWNDFLHLGERGWQRGVGRNRYAFGGAGVGAGPIKRRRTNRLGGRVAVGGVHGSKACPWEAFLGHSP